MQRASGAADMFLPKLGRLIPSVRLSAIQAKMVQADSDLNHKPLHFLPGLISVGLLHGDNWLCFGLH